MKPQSSRSAFCEYHADSGRGSGNERAICILLTQPDDVLAKNDNFVLDQLSACGLDSAIGLYFYRFRNTINPFIKIGECTRKDGISVRFQRGWHGTEKYADTYLCKKTKSGYVDSELLKQIRSISSLNPAYFIFYEHQTLNSHPKIDEMYAYRLHKRLFGRGTASPERMNSNPLLARSLIWHRSAFQEAVRGVLPDGSSYPSGNDD